MTLQQTADNSSLFFYYNFIIAILIIFVDISTISDIIQRSKVYKITFYIFLMIMNSKGVLSK